MRRVRNRYIVNVPKKGLLHRVLSGPAITTPMRWDQALGVDAYTL